MGRLGVTESTPQSERQAAVESARDRRQAAQERTPTESERALQKELEDVGAYARAVTDPDEKEAVTEYMRSVREGLERERAMNDILVEQVGVSPQDATRADWKRAADAAEAQALEMFEEFSKEGIELSVQRDRMALPEAREELVGGEWIQTRRGRYSRAQAARVKAGRWQDAQSQISDALSLQLRHAGYSKSTIEGLSLKDKRRLLQELGTGRIARTQRGAAKIGQVSVDERFRVLTRIDPSMQERCRVVADDPLSAPGLGAYQKAMTADAIRMRYLGGQAGTASQAEPSALNF